MSPEESFMDNRIGWNNIKALKTGRIYYDIDPDLILRPGPRIKEGLLELYKRFYED
jgi:iron complex transport system substrate-binding protein